MSVTKEMIIEGLKKLGLKKGDMVIVHSDLGKLGKPRDLVKLPNCGADLVIDAFLDAVGPEGTVVFPTFTKTYADRGPVGLVYDPKETPSRVGSITDLFWRRPGAERSLQPTHSIAAIGAKAKEVVAGPEDQTTFDRRGPWGHLYDNDAWICFFGTDNRTNTTVHVVEEWMELPYLFDSYAMTVVPDGKPKKVLCKCAPHADRDFYRANSKSEQALKDAGLYENSTTIGSAEVRMFRTKKFHEVMRNIIIKDPCILLDTNEGASDWSKDVCKKTIEHVGKKFGAAK